MSLKVHNSRDGSTEFQQVETHSQNKRSEDRSKTNTHSNKTQVTIIGISNTNGIECQKLSSRYRTDKILAYTIAATQTEIQKLTTVPELLMLHSITNDIKTFTLTEFYFAPKNTTNVIEILEKDIIEIYSQKGDILLTGDLNARTGLEPDYIVDDTNTYIPISFDNYDTDFDMEKRVSQDIVIDTRDLLDNLQSNNPKEYWSLVNSLREEQMEKPKNSIEADTWLKYFSNVSSIPSSISDKVKQIEEKLKLLETKTEYSSTLNNDITSSELQKVTSKLKSGKSLDRLSNEMLKSSQT
ncbi:unnamed protein product [Mytilus coruscus]|uniref:Endonuclease/exonuclease/phosphatase domain-containing protein n=1 Tax=Mytilus coruscus TaxID=42192 RepID=A0A6J8BW68_MYTCO|nr:unnamed protein product [Mytilus coruscus]